MKFVLFLFLLINNVFADYSYKNDLIQVLSNSTKGFYQQFLTENALPISFVSYGALAWAFNEDDRLVNHYGKSDSNTLYDVLDGLGTITNFNVIPLSFYFFGNYNKNEVHRAFAMESLSAWVLTSMEVLSLSFINIHERPIGNNSSEVSPWEKNFRGDSSFPSGHVVPSMILTLESFHHYGVKASILPGLLTMAISYERVRSKKHYPSDVLGSFVLSYFAVNGVRRSFQAQKKENGVLPSSVIINRDKKYLAWNFSY